MIAGTVLILAGILIALHPPLLSIIVASVLILLGILTLWAAYTSTASPAGTTTTRSSSSSSFALEPHRDPREQPQAVRRRPSNCSSSRSLTRPQLR